ncbi:MAG: ATP-binding protein [Planctomycetaceae bacterium TMED240]|nr:ATP-binding protein [Rhodopirellula sp.]OUX05709.1 MAG: ATP-binding protein [Planctomycetaceae bacterium TMED240]
MNESKAAHHLVVSNLTKSFSGSTQTLDVLQDVSLELSAGDSVAIVGPSGSGKSTLLQILGTLDHPNSGTVSINGIDPFELDENALAQFRNQHIGFVFQDHHLLPHLTVLENVLVPALASGKTSKDQVTRGHELIESVGLADRHDHLPGELSGGERERVAIARSLLMNPSLILADEPTGNLDRATAESISELLLELQQASGAILIAVTHSDALASAMKERKELVDGQLV